MEKLSFGLECGYNWAKKLFRPKNKSIITAVESKGTRAIKSCGGKILGYERNITLKNGERGRAVIYDIGNTRNIQIYNQNGECITSVDKSIFREKGASVFGGDKVTIVRDCDNRELIELTKEYSKDGVLQRKEVTSTPYWYDSDLCEMAYGYTTRRIQDRASVGHELTSGYTDLVSKESSMWQDLYRQRGVYSKT